MNKIQKETEAKAESEKKTTKNVVAVLNDKAEMDCDGEEQKRRQEAAEDVGQSFKECWRRGRALL